MALIAAHLAKVSLERTTHNPVVAHIGKESIRQAGRRVRRSGLHLVHGHTGAKATMRSAKGFNPRAQRISSKAGAMKQMREPGASRGGASFGHGGYGGMGMGGGWHGK